MSRSMLGRRLLSLGFPRVSGDEPPCPAEIQTACEFSPRERG